MQLYQERDSRAYSFFAAATENEYNIWDTLPGDSLFVGLWNEKYVADVQNYNVNVSVIA